MYIKNNEIAELLSMQECIKVMHDLFSLNAIEDIKNPLRTKLALPEAGLLGMMPAYIIPYKLMGIKVLTVFPNNYKKGLSSHQGIVHLFETDHGKLLTSFDADELTAIRTAAVSALATDLLASKNAKTLCLIGSGKQAVKHLESIVLVRNIDKVTIWSQNESNAINFVKKLADSYSVEFQVCKTVKDAVVNADIICTVTASRTPILYNEWLKDNVHINAVGACDPKSRELDSSIIKNAEIFVDNYTSAVNESGALLITAKEMKCDVNQFIKADIHQVLNGDVTVNNKNKTVFKSLGLAVEDIAAAYYCYNKQQNLHKPVTKNKVNRLN